ncbi:MAG: ABC transporter ATP-binding protein/permease [Candidatus Nomurabacteria bacterium]|jgi:ATP-binding cassette subfamily B protein|nr:ABC transporter ATP-binding protein/permease [Candidatus Nomurabacteria bacterium]
MSKQTDALKKIQANKPHGPAAMRLAEKPKNFSKTMKQLGKYLKPYSFKLAMVMIFAIASTVFAIISPRILGNMTNQIVDDYVKIQVHDQIMQKMPEGAKIPEGTTLKDLMKQMGVTSDPAKIKEFNDQLDKMSDKQRRELESLDLSKKPDMNWQVLGETALWLIGLYILSMFFGYIQGWILAGVTQKVAYKFRRDISEKINRLPLKYFDTRSFGDVLSRITNDVDMISQTLSQSLSQMITSITTIIGILVMMLSISWQMTGIAIITIPLSLIFIMLIVKRSQKYFKKQQDSLGAINGHIEEIYAGHNVVKVFAGEKQAIKTFRKYNEDLRESAWKSQFLSGLMFPIMNFIGNLSYVAVAVVGGWLAINGRINIGDIQAFIQYVQQFNQPIIQVANIANVIQSTAAAERVFEFLGEHNEKPDPVAPLILENPRGDVEFDNIKFGYDQEKEIIHGFSAKIKAGQTVAIVGPTGAGKTTMVNLLMRFYDPWSGSIKIDGVDTKEMTRADVRKNFAMVLQDTWLFHGTVRENLGYGDLNATQTQIEAAAKAAHVDHFIRSLPHGYDTVLEEDAENISSGEKQLLTIARAMLADAPMLILDEATSNVDTRTEILIQKAMNKLMQGRTSFVIAHRLSTIRDADLILVMNNGDIIEHGNHSELIAQNGFYAKLYNSQFAE